jgi:hypothetical protein
MVREPLSKGNAFPKKRIPADLAYHLQLAIGKPVEK